MSLGVVAQPLIPAYLRKKHEDVCGFEASLVYITSTRQAKAEYQNLLSKKEVGWGNMTKRNRNGISNAAHPAGKRQILSTKSQLNMLHFTLSMAEASQG